ncbi:sodium-dependent transporter [Ornithinimicrobium tianjinense]|uniref:Sodium-dependent transporter n=1 Tax=Ornithinimicrobium tianjinense TaxID=1195761 RepID=A0A917BIZ6_9MICO|nr:sodium-dependent transporter [Ornithinimicrobium tianjinense]GGF45460.1 sodium-dependent transporter [Ornithinimicrobium tianjinense]
MATPSNAPVATENRETWTSNTGFILAAVGSAVGLGNIWRFPGVAYESGGGAFMIPYLCALLTAGIPILFLDYAIGHRYRAAAPLAYRRIRKPAEALGWFQILLSFVIAVYYAAVIAWAMSYFVFAFDLSWGQDTLAFFVGDYLQVGDPEISTTIVPGIAIPLVITWVAVLIAIALGVAKGVEKVNVLFIPLLFVAFIGLVIRALTLPGALDGLTEFFTPDWAALGDLDVWIAAYSQIFFSLSIAFGIMVTYASFQRRKANMTSSGLVVAFANSSFELLAGIGVFATLGFMAHQQSTQVSELEGLTGPILSFVTFPAVINEMPGGTIFGVVFFASLIMAGFTSIISILLGVAASVGEKFGLGWRTSAVSVSAVCAVLSIGLFSTTSGLIALDTVDQFANNVGIVLSAIVMTVLLVWVYRRGELLRQHLNAVSTFKVGKWWIVLIGFVGPVFLVIMLVQKLVSLVSEGYEGYPGWYVGLFGWGTVVFVIVMAAILTAIPWKGRDQADFRPWPELEEEHR